MRRGEVREDPEDEPPPPRWTPFPGSPILNRLRKAVLLELGPFSVAIYTIIFLNAFVLCLDHAGASENTEEALAGVSVFGGGGIHMRAICCGRVGTFTDTAVWQ